MKKIVCISLISLLLFFENSAQQNDSLFFNLSDLLKSYNGNKISTSDEWESIRRNELLELFENNVYGKIPNNIKVKFSLKKEIKNALCGKATLKEIETIFYNQSDSLVATTLILLPNNVDKPVPLFLGMNFYGNHTIHADTNISISSSWVANNVQFCIENNKANHLSRGVRSNRWPVERILERGYGLANIYYGDIDPDFDDGFQNGIHKLVLDQNHKITGDEWGSISAWAFGLSKAMDYFETDKDVDKNKIIVFGHSRLGKTALWAGAIDQRFAMVISNNSGCGGAALSRRKSGERLTNINTAFPHWFCKNFHKFNNQEELLPIDQNMLIALIAPRPIYVASAESDLWADPLGEYLSMYYSTPVYQLYNQDVFGSPKLPELNQPKIIGKYGYHIRSGSHDVTKYDWEQYLNFADRHLK